LLVLGAAELSHRALAVAQAVPLQSSAGATVLSFLSALAAAVAVWFRRRK
jgi:hypothetical protein